MIHDVDETLRQMLTAELSKAGTLVSRPEQITFDPPATAEAASGSSARVNLYLHDVRENLALRDQTFHRSRHADNRTADIRRAPVVMNLSYLVTVYAENDPSQEHRLLAETLGVLLRCQAVPAHYLAGGFQNQTSDVFGLAVAQPEHLANSHPPSLWQALGGRLRPALSLVVTAPYDPYAPVVVPLVREAVFGFGQGLLPEGAQRALDLKGVRVSATGFVTDAKSGNPLEQVLVMVEGRDEKAMTDSRGFYMLLNLPVKDLPDGDTSEARKYRLRFKRRGYKAEDREVAVPPPGRPDLLTLTELALTVLNDADHREEENRQAVAQREGLSDGESLPIQHIALTGKLCYADGRPAAYIPVSCGRQRVVTDGEGVYCFFDLPEGNHAVIAEPPGQKPLAAGISTPSSENRRAVRRRTEEEEIPWTRALPPYPAQEQ